MKKIGFILLLGIALMLSGCAARASSAEPESQGSEIPENLSVVSTSVAICKILDALEYDDVVGVPETAAELPARYDGLQTVGAPMNPDYEIIKSIAPGLVLSPQTLESSLAPSYLAAGINCAFLDLSSVEGMYGAIASLGRLLGREEQAEKLVSEYEEFLDAYKTDEDGPSVLLLMTFPDGFYLVATEDSYVGNLVKLAGGRNVYDSGISSDESGFASISPEDILLREPDIIMVFAHYSEERAFEYMASEFESAAVWQYYDAVNEGRVYYLPSAYFGMSATLDWTLAIEHLRPMLFSSET